jgi:hypothetical protein
VKKVDMVLGPPGVQELIDQVNNGMSTIEKPPKLRLYGAHEQ